MGGSGTSVLPHLDGDHHLSVSGDQAWRKTLVEPPCAESPELDTIRWRSALPGIRTRLVGRHRHQGVATVDGALNQAIEDTAGARVENYRAVLVERRADRLLREAASPKRTAEDAAR